VQSLVELGAGIVRRQDEAGACMPVQRFQAVIPHARPSLNGETRLPGRERTIASSSIGRAGPRTFGEFSHNRKAGSGSSRTPVKIGVLGRSFHPLFSVSSIDPLANTSD
jgi:hypothetical protein